MAQLQMEAPDVKRWIAEYIRGSDNPDFRTYGDSILRAVETDDADRFMWSITHLMKLGRIYDARVLDVGCGFGWHDLAISLLGHNHVVANDIRESMTVQLAERIAAVKAKGAPVSVEALTGDICSIDIAPQSFDAIISNEAIEHVHDLDAMFDVCFRVLRPGGRCVITNDNNALNKKKLAEIEAMWQQRDRSWDVIEQLKRERPIENYDIEPYAVSRERIVRLSNPKLTDEDVERIVTVTAGMIEVDIANLARSYTHDTELPTPPAFSWCRNPFTGEYCERQLDPYAVTKKLASHGFKTAVRHMFRKFPLCLLNGVRLKPLNMKLFGLRPAFVIVGRKPLTAK